MVYRFSLENRTHLTLQQLSILATMPKNRPWPTFETLLHAVMAYFLTQHFCMWFTSRDIIYLWPVGLAPLCFNSSTTYDTACSAYTIRIEAHPWNSFTELLKNFIADLLFFYSTKAQLLSASHSTTEITSGFTSYFRGISTQGSSGETKRYPNPLPFLVPLFPLPLSPPFSESTFFLTERVRVHFYSLLQLPSPF